METTEKIFMDTTCRGCEHQLSEHFTTYNNEKYGCSVREFETHGSLETLERCRCPGFGALCALKIEVLL